MRTILPRILPLRRDSLEGFWIFESCALHLQMQTTREECIIPFRPRNQWCLSASENIISSRRRRGSLSSRLYQPVRLYSALKQLNGAKKKLSNVNRSDHTWIVEPSETIQTEYEDPTQIASNGSQSSIRLLEFPSAEPGSSGFPVRASCRPACSLVDDEG